jgi:hypothetical protein
MITADQICEKTNGYPRAVIPLQSQHLTMFIDVYRPLYYFIATWNKFSATM